MTGEFIKKTNEEYVAWCKTYYNPEALDERGMQSLHGLWAWQEQERRMEELRQQVAMLREPLLYIDEVAKTSRTIISVAAAAMKMLKKIREALAATEAKEQGK